MTEHAYNMCMNDNMKRFEVGKVYEGSYGSYKVVKRTKCFIELSNGKRCKIKEWGQKECIGFKRLVSYWGLIEKEEEWLFAK
jgi:hypothetical protein